MVVLRPPGDPNPSTHSPCPSSLFFLPTFPTSQSRNDLGYLSPAVCVALKIYNVQTECSGVDLQSQHLGRSGAQGCSLLTTNLRPAWGMGLSGVQFRLFGFVLWRETPWVKNGYETPGETTVFSSWEHVTVPVPSQSYFLHLLTMRTD